MKWEGRRESKNVTDNRGKSAAGKTALGGGLIGIIATLLYLFGGETGKQIAPVIEQMGGDSGQTEQVDTRQLSQEEVDMGKMVAVMFADTEDVWHKVFKENGMQYREPKMELFDDKVNTQCGSATADVGPFYCPADETVYMDLRFFEELHTRFGAERGNFAIAYVIAHEVGHHVQTLLGTNSKVHQAQQGMSKKEANKLSVGLELQADFYAGVWAKYNQKYLDAKDIDIALSAAQAVGDDAIQKRVTGQVNPDSFTHGTSKQRKEWFMKGFETADIKQGNTFDFIR
ncbi:zinc metallopeptidase [Myroides marinus]|jgi:predicted metalloprotease|uniref:Metalloprotease n=1 Tax=Myroides marinus TaxID=703342 RepID=A0A164AII1_9FLAO|nr:neutral zinc metallopeptidase [Myroides marinus]MDR0194100.1 zinc metallopeptidase [Myroides sp.]KUF40338.1 metalloprotease [Myroides marinus]KZE83920.1 metalloprotease [Myroides marinus]MDM1347600.1 zinc metallopeptidase [Myroides marinus]MDM1350653.1 zinc metallopeptidase [Myroides marinus]